MDKLLIKMNEPNLLSPCGGGFCPTAASMPFICFVNCWPLTGIHESNTKAASETWAQFGTLKVLHLSRHQFQRCFTGNIGQNLHRGMRHVAAAEEILVNDRRMITK